MSSILYNKRNKLLPGFCKALDDEVLSSWLARLAFRHGISTVALCRMIFNGPYGMDRDIDRLMRRDDIELLAQRTNSTIKQVETTMLSSYKGALFFCKDLAREKEPWLLPCRWLRNPGYRGRHFSSGLLFCPFCLKKNGYFKKEWRLALSFVCAECGCYLLDSCPHCGKGNSFMEDECKFSFSDVNLYMLGCHSCGKDVTECEPTMAQEEVLNLQQHLYDIMDYSSMGVPYMRESYLQVLHAVCSLLLRNKLKLRNLAADVFELNDVFYQSIKHYQLRLLNTEQRSDVITAAHWLLHKWPERFLNLCKNNLLMRDEVLAELPPLPSWFIEPIYYDLDYKTSVRPKQKMGPFIEYSARPKEMPIKIVDYNYDMYDLDEYSDEDALYYEPKPGHRRIEGLNRYEYAEFKTKKKKYLPSHFGKRRRNAR